MFHYTIIILIFEQMGSRFVWQLAAGFFIIGGLIGKFGAAFAIVPDPIIGGILLTGYAMVLSIALSNLQVRWVLSHIGNYENNEK